MTSDGEHDAREVERATDPDQYAPGVTSESRGATAMHRRARRDLEAALEDLIVRAKTLIASTDDDQIIEMARRIRAESIDVTTYAVLARRAGGASWAEIAVALSLDETFVREHYEPIEARWSAGDGVGPVVHRREGQRLRVISG
jgi:hypothetical protein